MLGNLQIKLQILFLLKELRFLLNMVYIIIGLLRKFNYFWSHIIKYISTNPNSIYVNNTTD